ncbi:MAG: O-antigen ligase family protein [Proteobacteria bacterium]|nr:O-antigen ligase family protein [Pseudomonadota bacterium]
MPLRPSAITPLLPVFPFAAVILLLPFGRASEAALLVCGIAALVLFARAPAVLSRDPAAKWFLMLWLCYFTAALVSAFDAVQPGKSWSTVAALLRFAPFGCYACWVERSDLRLRALYGITGALVALWTLDAWVQAFTGYSLGGHAEALRLSGIFGADDLKLGPVLAVLSPFLLWSMRERFGRSALVAAMLALLGPILLAGERSAWLMYALVVAAFLWREARTPARFVSWLACAAVIAALAAGLAWKTSTRFEQRAQRTLAVFNDPSHGLDTALSGRMDIWRTALKMVAAHPINGVGVRGFRYAYPQFAAPGDHFVVDEACGPGEGACHPHQIVLEVLDETGAVGLALWLLGATLAVRAWKKAAPAARARAWPAAVALGVMVFPLNTHLAFYSAWWGLLFWWLLGVQCAALGGDRVETRGPVAEKEPGHGA